MLTCTKALADDASTAEKHLSAAPAQLGFTGVTGATADPEQRQTQAQVILEASVHAKNGVVSFARQSGTTHLALKLTAPLDEHSVETTPLQLDGLASNATGEVSFARWQWSGPTETQQNDFRQLCLAKLQKRHCRVSDFAPGDPDHQRARTLMQLDETPWFFGGGAVVGRTDFSFLDATTLVAGSQSRTDWRVKVRAGAFTGFGFLVVSLGFGQSSSPAAAATDVCRPIGSTGSLSCREAVLGGPTEARTSSVKIELRRLSASNIAIAPSVERDFERQVTAVVLPVYFLKDRNGSAIGGVRISWRSDEGGVSASAFIGSAFTLTP